MSQPLGRTVIALSVGGMVAGLLLAGLGSATVLVLQAQTGLDQALLAAAQSEAHPWAEERWRAQHTHTIVEVRPWTVDDPLVPPAAASRARASEGPVWLDPPGRRVLVLAVEPDHPEDDDELDHPHLVLVAEAPAVTWVGSAGPFLAGYAVVALAIALGLSGALVVVLSREVAPLRRAADRIDTIRGLDAEARAPVEGPEEVRRLTQAVNDLLDRLSAAHGAQRRFTAEAAHELRTPVSALLGELELALRQERTPEAYRLAIGEAHRAARRLSDLVEALLVLARVDAGQAAQDRARVHVTDLVYEAVQIERQGLEAAGCTLEVSAPDPGAIVQVQPALVVAAVRNLLRNAAVHAAGGPVQVGVERAGNRVLVQVADRGPGLPEADAERVFERFERGDRRRAGLGLGLPLAREIARRHGGDVQLAARAGGGLVATLTLPAP